MRMTEQTMTPDERTARIETFKFWTDYHKHLTTLASGSIVLLTAFIEKLFKDALTYKPAVIVALLGFAITIFCSVVALSVINMRNLVFEDKRFGWMLFFALTTILSMIGFCGGMLALTTFAVHNLWLS